MFTKLFTHVLIWICCLGTAFAQTVNLSNGKSAEMIPFQMASQTTQTYGFLTFGGTYIGINHLKNAPKSITQTVGKSIQEGLIELRSGDIYYAEEVEYIAVPEGEFTGASRALQLGPTWKAPHNPK